LNGLYLNLAGREKYGIVQASDKARVIDEIAARLEALQDPRDGQRVVARAYKAHEVYHGDALANAPDIVVGWAAGYRSSWQTALGAMTQNTVEDNQDEWRGDHCIAAELVPATFLSNRKSKLKDIWLGDLTVTLLHEFGVAPGEGMRGHAIF
jgi:predicted AlkP superfamily phosphohydrolase/phosphomutase